MIEINLLPEELKTQRVSAKTEKKKNFFFLIPVFFVILIVVHLFLLLQNIALGSSWRLLDNRWKELEPQRKLLENFNREYAILSQDATAIKQLTQNRVSWAEKLNKLSLMLPSGIWFNELAVSGKDFILSAEVVSLEKAEMGLINKFMESLKKDTGFFRDFSKIELSSVQKKSLGGFEVADFTITGSLKVVK